MLTHLVLVTVLVATAFVGSADAKAKVVSTGPLFTEEGTGRCAVGNVGEKVMEVHTDVLSLLGEVVGLANHTLDPGNAFSVSVPSGEFPGGGFWCRFTVSSGSASDFRGSAHVIIDGLTRAVLEAR